MAEELATLPVPEDFLHASVTVDEKTRMPDLVDETSRLIFSRLLLHPACLSLYQLLSGAKTQPDVKGNGPSTASKWQTTLQKEG